jgi:hypothetical protein
MKRDRVRSMVFNYQLGRYFGVQKLKFETPLATLTDEHRRELELAHLGGNRADVNWATERAAVEELGVALETLGTFSRSR